MPVLQHRDRTLAIYDEAILTRRLRDHAVTTVPVPAVTALGATVTVQRPSLSRHICRPANESPSKGTRE